MGPFGPFRRLAKGLFGLIRVVSEAYLGLLGVSGGGGGVLEAYFRAFWAYTRVLRPILGLSREGGGSEPYFGTFWSYPGCSLLG